MITRRTFLRRGLATSGGIAARGLIPLTLCAEPAGAQAPALLTSAKARPTITQGIVRGDVTGGPAGGKPSASRDVPSGIWDHRLATTEADGCNRLAAHPCYMGKVG